MKGLVYRGPRDVRVEDVPDAKIDWPTDVLVRITSTNICGSDLHMYEGRTDLEPGMVIGHENLGQVIEVGSAVKRIKKGDWVCMPFNVACGYCRNCERGYTGFCLSMNPDPKTAGAAYGYAGMGPYRGGQAELLTVPYGDFNCLRLHDDAEEKETDYVMLSDIWPTGWHATELAGVKPGETVVVFGCGPVGLMAAYSAILKGAAQVYSVDRHPDRLRLAKSIGAIPIDDSKDDPVEAVMELTHGLGADVALEAVGVPQTFELATELIRPGGRVANIGVHGHSATLHLETLWIRNVTITTGLVDTSTIPQLMQLIAHGRLDPTVLATHRFALGDTMAAYDTFADAASTGALKVVLQGSETKAPAPAGRAAALVTG